MRVSLCLLEYFLVSSSFCNWDIYFSLSDVANHSFLKSNALYKTLDNRKLLAEKDALIAKRWDEYLDMRNKFYEANHQHTRESYLLKQQIKSLEEEKKKL